MENIFNKIVKYNPWEGFDINLGLLRSEYLNNILNYIGNKLVKVFVGQRRCGKSYLMRQIIKALITNQNVNPHNIFYLNKEYTAYDEMSSSTELEKLFLFYRDKLNVSGKIYLFIDEIQNIDRWETFVNSYAQDFTADYEIFITGSNSNLLSGELASLLSGRYVTFEILPFSLSEFGAFKNLGVTKSLFLEYLQTGGLPELLNLPDDEVKKHYVGDLKNTIVLRDIIQRNQVKDVTLLEDVFKFLSASTAGLISVTSIVNHFKNKNKQTNYETISTYIKYLLDTFVMHEVERYNLRGKQTLGGNKKYYLNDLAFKNYLLGYYPSDIGHHLENFVFLQLKRLGYKVAVGILYQKEIDFVAEKDDKTIYIQVAYILNDQNTIDREFGNLLAIKDNHEKFVISLDEVKFSGYKGIRHLWPWELV